MPQSRWRRRLLSLTDQERKELLVKAEHDLDMCLLRGNEGTPLHWFLLCTMEQLKRSPATLMAPSGRAPLSSPMLEGRAHRRPALDEQGNVPSYLFRRGRSAR